MNNVATETTNHKTLARRAKEKQRRAEARQRRLAWVEDELSQLTARAARAWEDGLSIPEVQQLLSVIGSLRQVHAEGLRKAARSTRS